MPTGNRERMPSPARFLQTTSSDQLAAAAPEPLTVGSDVVVVLAALLCALFCAVGMALVARCAWLRRHEGGAPNKGLNKKVIRSLPKQSYGIDDAVALGDCPICLAEFVQGDEIRILPQCGHGFHVGCIDTWFVSHSSCPSCRRVLVAAVTPPPSRCQRCGARAASSSNSAASASAAESNTMAGEDGGEG